MRRKLFLHVGVHRTATSSVQTFLFNNTRPLRAMGLFYPYRVKRHNGLMRELRLGEKDAAKVADGLSNRADARAAESGKPIDGVILSDEDLCCWEDFSPLKGFEERFDIHPVVALRRQDTWLESWYFQNVKWQWNPDLAHATFDEFMARIEDFHWLDYDRLVRRLDEAFGPGRTRAYIYEKAAMPTGPVDAFCAAIGLDDTSGFEAAPHINHSRSPVMTEFMRRLPLGDLPEGVRHAVSVACMRVDQDVLGHKERQIERIMPLSMRRVILERFAEGNASLATRHFGRAALFEESLPPEDAPLARLALPPEPGEVVEQLVGPLIKELHVSGALGSRPKPAKK